MNNKTRKILLSLSLLTCMTSLVGCNKPHEEYDEDGKLKIQVRNLYFNKWVGDDQYLKEIEDKFNVKFSVSAYDWNNWSTQVNSAVASNNLPDAFHFNLDSYNIENSYRDWAEGGVIKALPKDMSKWPNLKALIEKCDNYDKLLIDGELYCIPILKNIEESNIDFSPFTYIYRRDWAKQWGVYKENDVYTWEEFIALLDKFYVELSPLKCAALADVEWGYPSVINFYKEFPHIFGIDNNRVAYNNYTCDKFLEGLELARNWSDGTRNYYGLAQYEYSDREGEIVKEYEYNKVGVFYENLSLDNYSTMRKEILKYNKTFTLEQLNDATAIMKVKGPDGKFALEGTQNWFSATFFNADISKEKLEKLLDVLEWTLTDEGTMMATYGDEGYDYTINDNGEVELLEFPGYGWEKDADGKYPNKDIAARCLRKMVTLCHDMNKNDPLVDKDAFEILNSWEEEMQQAKASGNLRVIKEDPEVEWLRTNTKAKNSAKMLEDANTSVVNYCYGNTKRFSLDDYKNSFKTTTWTNCLNEMNELLGRK